MVFNLDSILRRKENGYFSNYRDKLENKKKAYDHTIDVVVKTLS